MANPASSCITLAKRANGAVRLKFCHYVLLMIQKDRVPQIQICHPSETDGTWSENYQKVNLSQLSQLKNKKAKQPSDVYSPAFCHREAQSIFIHSIYNYWYAGLMTFLREHNKFQASVFVLICNTVELSDPRPCSSNRYHWNSQVQVVLIKPSVKFSHWAFDPQDLVCHSHRSLTYSYFTVSTLIKASEVNKKLWGNIFDWYQSTIHWSLSTPQSSHFPGSYLCPMSEF